MRMQAVAQKEAKDRSEVSETTGGDGGHAPMRVLEFASEHADLG